MRTIKNNIFKNIKNTFKALKFKWINLSFSKQIILIWSILAIISLFLDWIKNNSDKVYYNSFDSLSWNIWFLIIPIILLTIFIILSTNYKEKIKLYSDFSFKNHLIIIFSWIFIISFCIIWLSFIVWLNIFFEWISYWNWIILALTAWIIILIWGLLLRREYYMNNSEIILNKLNQNRENKKENNMELPF